MDFMLVFGMDEESHTISSRLTLAKGSNVLIFQGLDCSNAVDHLNNPEGFKFREGALSSKFMCRA